jgi:molybdopterin synthase sulfur carrier subunit
VAIDGGRFSAKHSANEDGAVIRILFFGRLGERLGRETSLELPDGVRSVADLRRELARLHPQAAADFLGPSLRACLDDVIVADATPIGGAREVAFFPPLSGG